MVKRKFVTVIPLICITISLYIIIYLSGTLNFCLGSNCGFYETAFDYESEWFCEKYQIYAKRINENYIELSSNLSEEKYVIRKMDHLTAGIQSYLKSSDYDDAQIFCHAYMKSYKKWWELYKFELYLGDNNFLYGANELVFLRK